jgi:hypothetical protein
MSVKAKQEKTKDNHKTKQQTELSDIQSKRRGTRVAEKDVVLAVESGCGGVCGCSSRVAAPHLDDVVVEVANQMLPRQVRERFRRERLLDALLHHRYNRQK